MIHSLLQSRLTCCVANRRPKNPYRKIIPLRRTEEKFKNRKLTQKVSFLRIVIWKPAFSKIAHGFPFFFGGSAWNLPPIYGKFPSVNLSVCCFACFRSPFL